MTLCVNCLPINYVKENLQKYAKIKQDIFNTQTPAKFINKSKPLRNGEDNDKRK